MLLRRFIIPYNLFKLLELFGVHRSNLDPKTGFAAHGGCRVGSSRFAFAVPVWAPGLRSGGAAVATCLCSVLGSLGWLQGGSASVFWVKSRTRVRGGE